MSKHTITKTDRLRMIMASVIGILMTGITIYSWKTATEGYAWLWLSVGLIILSVILVLMRFRYNKLIDIILAVLTPAAVFVLVENFSHTVTEVYTGALLLNLLLYYAAFTVLFFLLGRLNIAMILTSGLFGLAGLANYFVVMFRSSPILPWDIFSIGVAASVADNFEYNLSVRACNTLLCMIFIWVLAAKTQLKIKIKKVRLIGVPLSLLFFVSVIFGVQAENVDKTFGLDTTLFTPKVLYRNNGMILSFTRNFRYLRVDKPDGYSAAHMKELTEALTEDSSGADSDIPVADAVRPNIIVIMNEAFSDLSVLGDYETNMEVMPFIDSLEENTQKGWMYSSVKGGNTANTEFEFLTGMSMYFLPTGSIPYQQYIKEYIPALPEQLSECGYTTMAMHPYYSSGWNRENVYDYFKFDQTCFLNDFTRPEKIRNYVSDWATYEKIIENYESKASDEKLFVFDVTMQNHGSYFRKSDNFTPDVEIIGGSGTYLTSTEQYLSLLKCSDQAFKQLVSYFKEQSEPTIILMFGDHQPADYVTNIIDTGKNYGDWGIDPNKERNLRKERFMVPYIMWANYDIEESSDEETSANYLALRLLKAAGIPMTDFQKYLQQLSESMPVISGPYVHNLTEESNDTVLHNYAMLQYNNLFDRKNRAEKFFVNTGK